MTDSTHDRWCSWCLADYTPSPRGGKFCSVKCSDDYGNWVYTAGGAPGRRTIKYRPVGRKVGGRLCGVCLKPIPGPNNPARVRYCSRQCCQLAEWWDTPTLGWGIPKPPSPPKDCEFCGHQFTGQGSCCSVEHSRFMTNIRMGRGDKCTVAYADCRECGRLFAGRAASQDRAWCSEACTKKAYRRMRKGMKRARRLHAQQGERFTTREIADRDGWRCHLCGMAVPDQPYKARDKDPTLDHLVPVSAGGAHTRTNVRLAHNRCNWERQTAGQVQLLLVG